MRDSRSAGFTILEAVVAVTIVGLAAVASLAAFGEEIRAGDRARTGLEIESLLEEVTARTRLLPVEALVSLPDSLREGRCDPPFQAYRWERVIEVVPGAAGLIRTTVTVGPLRDTNAAENGGGTRSITTLLYRPALLPGQGS